MRTSLRLLALALLLPLTPALAAGNKKSKGNSAPPPPPPAQSTNNSARQADEKAVDDARTAVNKAQQDLDAAVAKLTADFEQSPDMVDAKKARDTALAASDAARKSVLDTLAADPAYKSATAAEAKARAQLDDLRANQAPQSDISAKSSEILTLGGNTSALERKALDADTTYTTAQKDLTAANAKLTSLRTTFKDSLKTNDSLTDKHKALSDAQDKLTAAQTKLKSDK